MATILWPHVLFRAPLGLYRLSMVMIAAAVLFTAVLILLENRKPQTAISWLLVLFAFPLAGILLYLLLGRRLRPNRWRHVKPIGSNEEIRRILDSQLEHLTLHTLVDESNDLPRRRLIQLILNNSHAPFTKNNAVTVLKNGRMTYASIFDAIEKAARHVHLEYYIIEDDTIGNALRRLLIRKAQEGVEVRLIYDGVGSRKLSRRYIQSLEQAGVETACFMPVKFPYITNTVNFRNHRKIIVVDGLVGFLGGINVGDEYVDGGKTFSAWRDTHLRMEGNAVYFLQEIFMNDWEFVTRKEYPPQRFFPRHEKYGSTLVQIAPSGPNGYWETIHQIYFEAIASAQSTVYLTTPYFIPDGSIMMAMKTAALSGVDVRLLIPRASDSKIVHFASMSYFEELLRAGVRIYLYEKGFNHAKILLVDGMIASVGTANMDTRSLEINFEVNALIYDHELVARLENDFIEDIQNSTSIEYEDFLLRPLSTRVKESVARLLSPLL